MNVYLVNNALMNLKLAKGYSKKTGYSKKIQIPVTTRTYQIMVFKTTDLSKIHKLHRKLIKNFLYKVS